MNNLRFIPNVYWQTIDRKSQNIKEMNAILEFTERMRLCTSWQTLKQRSKQKTSVRG